MVSSATNALPYHEPDIVTILILASFILLLNFVSSGLDRLIYCGLIGQILLGVVWGTPGAAWLGPDIERFLVNLGYLGLLLLVFEGGLTTSFKSLKANLLLSLGVALTGISLPVALSFVLVRLAGATPLQAFAAGAALCSTSLGTTFTVLGASGLTTTRMGVVLTSAAMLDDVVGLVMVQVISNLGVLSTSFSTVTVIRPVFVSLGFAVIVPLIARFLIRPVTLWMNHRRISHPVQQLERIMANPNFVFLVHTGFLVAMATGASYAGTSNLFAAYLTGATISWWDSELPHPSVRLAQEAVQVSSQTDSRPSSGPVSHVEPATAAGVQMTGSAIFEAYYQAPLERILIPFFFASIGFSIPITRLFSGTIVWKGMVYTIFMAIGKLACGIWLVRLPGLSTCSRFPKNVGKRSSEEEHDDRKDCPKAKTNSDTNSSQSTRPRKEAISRTPISDDHQKPFAQDQECGDQISNLTQTPRSNEGKKLKTPHSAQLLDQLNEPSTKLEHQHQSQSQSQVDMHNPFPPHPNQDPNAPKPVSLYPAAILGCAMVARGEIGFLISSLAQSNGIFSSSSSSTTEQNSNSQLTSESPIFLIVTWAIMLCTIFGPLCVGLLVKRVRKLEGRVDNSAAGGAAGVAGKDRNVLGVWGVG